MTLETSTPEPTIEPTQVPIPMGLIRVPITGGARQTAQEINSTDLPAHDLYRTVQEMKGMTTESLVPIISENPEFNLHDRQSFFFDKDLSGDIRSEPAILSHIGEHSYWWKNITVQVEDDEIIGVAHLFEQQILPMNRELFGQEWSPGIDNDPRVHILLVDESRWGDATGYFNSVDEYSDSLEPFSNQKELIYVNLGAVDINSKAFLGELARNYQDMIHWNQDPNEEVWLVGAMSKLAVFITGSPPKFNGSRLSNAEFFAADPSTPLTSRPEVRSDQDERLHFPHYGAERLFAIYLYEQFGAQLINDILMNPANGIQSINSALDKLPGSPKFEDVFANWIVANLLNRTSLENGQFGYRAIRPAPPNLEPVVSFTGQPVPGQLPPYGSRYYEIRHTAPIQVDFVGSTMARLTPADPASGEFAWYSNRGDKSEAILSHIFDLSLVDSATLKYKVWYQLEDYHDYAYVEISLDGGRTWEILHTIHGTEDDPYQVALGPGYTGSSTVWKFDSIDLTPYSGQKVQIRFHVITDGSTNWEGFQVDDIAVPELGYFDGAEEDRGGWQSQGFIRSSNLVPVDWILWLVKSTNPIQVERISLSSDQTASFRIGGLGEDFNQARIIVSPTAPLTTLGIDYEIEFTE